MAAFTGIALAISILSLIGSLSSFIGASFITICYLILPIRRHFRHSLILNLAIADLLNGLNNSISGLWILANERQIEPSNACTANGLIGQITVQGTDCSILAIAIVTLYALTRQTQISETLPRRTTVIICIATWILPLTTGFTALGLGKYGPVSGNWCWISPSPTYLRYVLTHGWRYVFILTEIIIYTYLHFYVRRRFGALLEASRNGSTADRSRSDAGIGAPQRTVQDDEDEDLRHNGQRGDVERGLSISAASDDSAPIKPVAKEPKPKFFNPFSHHREVSNPKDEMARKASSRTSRVRKILLLNAYPAAYIILWIPGIINRLYEASGNSSRVLHVLQASTQFVGLANAITYGWNERVGQQLRDYCAEKFGSRKRRQEEEIAITRLKSENTFRLKMQSSRERLRELRDNVTLKSNGSGGTRNEDKDGDQGELMFTNGRWEWSRNNSVIMDSAAGSPTDGKPV